MADGVKDWSELGEDLLCMIGQRLMTIEDVIRSRAVCNPWSRAQLAEQQRRIPPFTQWLMLPYCTSNNMNMAMAMCSTVIDSPAAAIPMLGCKGSKNCRCFYDVALHRFHHIEFPPGLQDKSYRGSTMGWLCIVDKTPGISLLNPLTKTEIPLPPATSFPGVLAYRPENAELEYHVQSADGYIELISKNFFEKKYLKRVVMSVEPTSEECIVMAIRWDGYDDRLTFCKPTEIEAGWKLVPHEEENGIPPATVTGDDDDQLMMVSRFTEMMDIDHQLDNGEAATKTYCTDKFKVFKMKKDASGWDEVNCFGEFALFLGFNSCSTFVPTKVHPRLIPNSIYFTDDFINSHRQRKHGGHDMGVYHLATHKIKPLYSTTSLHNNPSMISPLPLWFSPSTVFRQ
ncbi:unnamed protein product [Linum tenue]|uniref:KIB1-4 beta-propeller domain-containing protein n=1 Tax=Linum tenue TaxID=586396 RepID=A0AAV0NV11_9ROSI|nr:unnamed protein product [Linum tenue]